MSAQLEVSEMIVAPIFRCYLGRLFCVLLFLGFQLGSAAAQPLFEDVTDQVAPFNLFESQGIAVGDYNNDGWMDLALMESLNWVQNGGDRMALLHNTGSGRFAHRSGAFPTDILHFDPRVPLGETLGAAVWGDYDNDGDLDLYVPLGGMGLLGHRNRNALLRNDRGQFTDVSQDAGLVDDLSSSGAIWLDYDRDGYLDLYVADTAISSRISGILLARLATIQLTTGSIVTAGTEPLRM